MKTLKILKTGVLFLIIFILSITIQSCNEAIYSIYKIDPMFKKAHMEIEKTGYYCFDEFRYRNIKKGLEKMNHKAIDSLKLNDCYIFILKDSMIIKTKHEKYIKEL